MCFDLAWLESLIIWLIIIAGVIGLLNLLANFLLPKLGLGGEVLSFLVAACRIVIWVIVAIAIVVFIFDLIFCLSGHLPSLRPR